MEEEWKEEEAVQDRASADHHLVYVHNVDNGCAYSGHAMRQYDMPQVWFKISGFSVAIST